MIIHESHRRVLYAETDKMGYLYYGHYASYYETGRAEFIRDHGVTYRDLEVVHKVMMPVAQMNCRYLLPAKYDDLLTIKTTMKALPSRIFHVHHEIINESGQVLNRGEVKLLFVDMETNTNVSCPDYIKKAFEPYF